MFKQPGAETFNNIAILIKNSQGFCDVNGRLVLKQAIDITKILTSKFQIFHLITCYLLLFVHVTKRISFSETLLL